MLCGLLETSFGSKCKSLLRVTLMRAELVQRKRKATEKILKKDLADLLAMHLELDAYTRAEGLLTELIISSGYEFIEDSCNWLLRNMSGIRRRKECPDKCKEAVASLMFAAAWFSDLPELRDLRDIFHSRYGKSMEFYVNQKFAESLKSKGRYSMEKKVRLMEQVATEFSVKWNSGKFRQRNCRDVVPAAWVDGPDGRREEPGEWCRKGHNKHKLSGGKEKAIMSRVTWYSLLHHDKRISEQDKPRAAKYEKLDNVQPKSLPETKQTHYLVGKGRKAKIQHINSIIHNQTQDAPQTSDCKQLKLRRPAGQCQCGSNKDMLPDTRRVVTVQPQQVFDKDCLPDTTQQRGVLASEANHNKKINDPNIIERKLGDRKMGAMTQQISIEEVNEDEVERIIDKLLIKYSRNPNSPEHMKIESDGQPSNQTSSAGQNPEMRINSKVQLSKQTTHKLALVPLTTRSISLPKEQTDPTEQERALTRISSCQQQRLAPHVHPKLPDYEELATKFAALKQQQRS